MTPLSLSIVVLAGLISAPKSANATTSAPWKSREEFVAAIKRIKVNMSPDDVRQILGAPDDIRRPEDFGDTSYGDFKELWCYGTDGHNTFPTLGRVWFGNKLTVQHSFGAEGSAPIIGELPEPELRRLLRLIDRVSGRGYSPLRTIQVVNGLQALGKENGVAVLREYVRIRTSPRGFEGPDRDMGFVMLLRVLFDVPADPGYMPKIFGFDPYPPEDPWVAPRWPIVIVDDVPFMVPFPSSFGNGLHLAPRFPDPEFEEFVKSSGWRARPLAPANNPLAAMQKLEESPQWTYGQDDDWQHSAKSGREYIFRQVLDLLYSVYRGQIGSIECDPKAKSFDQVFAEATALNIRWDPSANQYTFGDGTSLPVPTPVAYGRDHWNPDVPGWKINLSMHRKDQENIEVTFRYSGKLTIEKPRFGVRLLSGSDQQREVGNIDFPMGAPPIMQQPSQSPEMKKMMEEMHARMQEGINKAIAEGRGSTSASSGINVELKTGQKLVAVLTYNGQTWTSPEFTP